MKVFLPLHFLLFTGAAFGAQPPMQCPDLPMQPSIRWESSHTSEHQKCEAKSESGDVLLSTFAAKRLGSPTYGLNFYAITHARGRTIPWFSDRDELGESRNIARTFFPSGIEELPVMMVWFEFKDPSDFTRKADLASQLELSR